MTSVISFSGVRGITGRAQTGAIQCLAGEIG
jgi:hypothetical protein